MTYEVRRFSILAGALEMDATETYSKKLLFRGQRIYFFVTLLFFSGVFPVYTYTRDAISNTPSTGHHWPWPTTVISSVDVFYFFFFIFTPVRFSNRLWLQCASVEISDGGQYPPGFDKLRSACGVISPLWPRIGHVMDSDFFFFFFVRHNVASFRFRHNTRVRTA